jgi:hypothetical protein
MQLPAIAACGLGCAAHHLDETCWCWLLSSLRLTVGKGITSSASVQPAALGGAATSQISA